MSQLLVGVIAKTWHIYRQWKREPSSQRSKPWLQQKGSPKLQPSWNVHTAGRNAEWFEQKCKKKIKY